MLEQSKQISPISIEQEMKQSYLDYAMSVIVGRALPDARDGLKPVHRRILFAMHESGNDWNKPYKKSARIVGDVMGKYHPHGDAAIYDSIVRMAQPFSMRAVLVDGQGNFGSVDGDAPAAMRYTEIRMSRIAHALLADLEKDTVDHAPNYDETEHVPVVLPTQLPNLLINGASGIAVGMATNIPPHNLGETIDACLAFIDNPEITVERLMDYLPGPDFPTAALIYGKAGILAAYRTGRGRLMMRARTAFETLPGVSGKQSIVVTELPYQVNKAKLLEKIGELVKEKVIEGITAIRDESDREGMRMVIELRRGENPDVVLNNLLAHTSLQLSFPINMVALDHGQPRTMGLCELLGAFVQHRREVVTRRSLYDLRKARERAHVLEGLAVALANIDRLVSLIKSSKNPAEAKDKLLSEAWLPGLVLALLQQQDSVLSRPEGLSAACGLREGGYFLSPEQAQAILDLRLHRLTGLEQEKIYEEYRTLLERIQSLLVILADPDRLMEVIREELLAVKTQFADVRRSEMIECPEDFSVQDLIPDEAFVVTISHEGYAKAQPLSEYQSQHRGGKGKSATAMKEEDFIEHLLIVNAHDTLLCFSNYGKVYWKKAYLLPQADRLRRGKPLVNLLPLAEGERISAVLNVRDYPADHYIVMATSFGTIKKTPLPDFSRARTDGIIAIVLDEGDRLVGVDITDSTREVMLFSEGGKVVRFHESTVRATGRVSRGVRGVRLEGDERVIALIIIRTQDTSILTATENGYGKRTALNEYRVSGRGTKGVTSIRVNERNGKVIGALEVTELDELMMISTRGLLVRTGVREISVVGRAAQGVRLIRLTEGERLVSMQKVVEQALED